MPAITSDLRRLRPAMGPTPAPEWAGATWIGGVDVAELDTCGERLQLADTDGYARARLLVRDGLAVLGFAEAEIVDDSVAAAPFRAVTREPITPLTDGVVLPPITVATTTRNRPHNIAPLVTSLLALDYPDFDVLIVDNASDDLRTVEAVQAIDDPRVRVVREPRPGASRGRNTALIEATHEIVAFVDDDVVVDPLWLRGVAQGFARAERVGIVSGMVPSGELLTPAQAYFESRIAWEVTGRARVFRLSDPPADIPLFPFEVGAYGTGANFAIRRTSAFAVGGLNEALGTGSPAGGGEDIDLFVRVLYAGEALVYEPTSLVWHRHRRDLADLDHQVGSYGRGFGAWIAAVLAERAMRRDALRLVVRALGRAHRVGESVPAAAGDDLPLDLVALRRREVVAMLTGPWWYARSRLDRRAARPLAAR